jgi:hypothetical protein
MKMKRLLTMALVLMVTIPLLASAAEKMALPKGYEKWEKSRQIIVTDKKSLFYGIHYTYVDKKAMPAFKSDGKYAEGSRFVVVNYNIKEEGGKFVQGKKNMIVLMEKGKKYRETGGWLFAGFTPEGKPSGIDPVKNCYECHLKMAKDTDLVISKYADFK